MQMSKLCFVKWDLIAIKNSGGTEQSYLGCKYFKYVENE